MPDRFITEAGESKRQKVRTDAKSVDRIWRKKMKRRIEQLAILVVVTVAVAGVAAPVQADAWLKQVTRTDPVTIMGQTQPGTTDTSEIWMSADKAYMTTEMGAAILRADLGVIYVVNSEASTYAELPLGKAAEMSAEMAKAMDA